LKGLFTDDVALLDVNVPMYAAGREHPYKAACAWLMTEIVEGRVAVAIDTEIIQEILYRYGALQCWEIGARLVENLLDIVPQVYPILIADVRTAIALFRKYAPQGVKARDTIHAAVMFNNGLAKIISTDAHFDRIEGIVRLDPQTLFAQAHRQ